MARNKHPEETVEKILAVARRLFAQYRACTRCYQDLWNRGRTVEQLAVRLGA